MDLKHLPTAVGRILGKGLAVLCSVDLNDLPTAVGRIFCNGLFVLCSADLKYLPTAVGRILLHVFRCAFCSVIPRVGAV